MSSSSTSASNPPESSFKRLKFLVPVVLTVNVAIGAYLFLRTKKKDVDVEEETTAVVAPTPAPSTSSAASTAAVTETVHVAQPTRVIEPIPEKQQRELFKWMLEEKRKIKTNDPEENKHIDQEKAILKDFIRAKSIPRI